MSEESPYEDEDGLGQQGRVPELKTKAERDFAFQKDIANTRREATLHEGNAFAKSHAEALLREARSLIEQLHSDLAHGKLIMKDDVDKIAMDLETCVAISGDENARLLLTEFLAEYPDAGTKKY